MRGQRGEVRRKILSERERMIAFHEKQELNVNGELTLQKEVGWEQNYIDSRYKRSIGRMSFVFSQVESGERR